MAGDRPSIWSTIYSSNQISTTIFTYHPHTCLLLILGHYCHHIYQKKPGVYWFLDKNQQVLYVGKAKNLKSRLSAYKLKQSLHPKTLQLVKKSYFTRFTTTENELTSILLEAKLINSYQPPYNLRLKDNKSPVYIVITKEDFPKILSTRKIIDESSYSRIFGPFISSHQTRKVLKITRRLFPYCNANRNSKSACFYFHINLCPGVCINKISQTDYAKNISHISKFLNAENIRLKKSLSNSINQLSDTQHFEEALELKRQLESLNYWTSSKKYSGKIDPFPNLTGDVNEHQLISLFQIIKSYFGLPNNYLLNRIEGYDVSNLMGQNASTSMVVFQKGAKSLHDYRLFKIKLNTPNDPAMLKEALQRRFKHPEWPYPQLVIIDGGKPQLNAALSATPTNIPVLSIAKNPERIIIKKTSPTNTYQTIKLDHHQPWAKLIVKIRDEAHRFSKSHHQKNAHQIIPAANLYLIYSLITYTFIDANPHLC